MSKWVPGVDVAFSRVSRQWCRDRRAEGCRVFVQDLWTGGYENNTQLHKVATANLDNAQAEGLIIAGYCNASPWFPAETSVFESRMHAGHMWDALDVVVCDVEINGLTEQQVKDTCTRLEDFGKKVPIYSAAWFWHSMGNPQWPWLNDHKLWEANYDEDPDIDFGHRRFGPWELADVMGEQYQGTTNIDGVDVDLNVFDLSYFEEGDMEPQLGAGFRAENSYWTAVEEAITNLRKSYRRSFSESPASEYHDWADLATALDDARVRTRILGRPG